MYEAYTTVVGTVITNPVKRSTSSGEEVIGFRMAANARRFDQAAGEWTDSGTLYLTVSCWRRLVDGVAASLMKGDPIVAYGQVRTNEYTTKEGVERSDLEMRAIAVGPDLARCVAKLERGQRVSNQTPEQDATAPVGDAADADARDAVAVA